MTLEERIKEIDRIANYNNQNESIYARAYTDVRKKTAQKALSIIQELQNKNKDLTRLEVIDESGRVYINNNCKMKLSYQDEGRTLKIFVNNEELINDKS